MLKRSWTIAIAFFLFLIVPIAAHATTEYARQTGYECGRCHVDPMGGGGLSSFGQKYLDEMKLKGTYRPLSEAQRVIRFVLGYIHLLIAIAWFGTILYVHVLLKPAYASKGLPKGELMLGWISMVLLLITGILLTISRIPSWATLYTTRFGILLSLKIFLFLIMVISALIVTLYIGPRMRKRRMEARNTGSKDLSLEGLCLFDGRDGRPAYISYNGNVYDVTGSKLWKSGSHMVKHHAGNDLTDALKTAPHGEEKILPFPNVGKLLAAGERPARPFHEKMFYFFAYMNLVFVFLITLIIALWRWEF